MKLKFKRSNKLGNNLGQATSLTLFYTPLYSLQNCDFGLFPFFAHSNSFSTRNYGYVTIRNFIAKF